MEAFLSLWQRWISKFTTLHRVLKNRHNQDSDAESLIQFWLASNLEIKFFRGQIDITWPHNEYVCGYRQDRELCLREFTTRIIPSLQNLKKLTVSTQNGITLTFSSFPPQLDTLHNFLGTAFLSPTACAQIRHVQFSTYHARDDWIRYVQQFPYLESLTFTQLWVDYTTTPAQFSEALTPLLYLRSITIIELILRGKHQLTETHFTDLGLTPFSDHNTRDWQRAYATQLHDYLDAVFATLCARYAEPEELMPKPAAD